VKRLQNNQQWQNAGIFCAKFAPKITLNPLDRKIRIGAVNYLNTRPLLYGLQHSDLKKKVELTLDYPSKIADQLVSGQIDIGLVPVAAIPRLREWHIVTDSCIGCDGPVASVAVFSDQPIETLDTILLDYQSRTSAALTRLLFNFHWKLHPHFRNTNGEAYRHKITGHTGGLVIGDRALEQRHESKFIYDLGEAWKDFSGLPFVFATWISNKPIDSSFLDEFSAANKVGMQHIEKVVSENPFPHFDMLEYYTKHISYNFDAEKRKGLELFLDMIAKPLVEPSR
jgi:chorismate dehydratase